MAIARASTLALGLHALAAWGGHVAAQDAPCQGAEDCLAESDASPLLQVRQDSSQPGPVSLKQTPQDGGSWTGVNAEDGLPSSVTAVLNQGNCGSCAAFSAIMQLGTRFSAAGKGFSGALSAQATLFAGGVTGYGAGCNGGLPSYYGDMFSAYGVPDEPCAPYEAASGCSDESANYGCYEMEWGTCYGSSSSWIPNGYSLVSNSIKGEDAMMSAISESGPISACFEVYTSFFSVSAPMTQSIYTSASGDLAGGHAIVLTGWGTVGSTPVWLLKNSWGSDWADGGYCMFARGSDLCKMESWDVSAFDVSSAAVQEQRQVSAPAGNASGAREALKRLGLPGGWVEQSADSGMGKQIVEAYAKLAGAAPEATSVRTRVVNGVAAELTLGAEEGGRGLAPGGPKVVRLLKPLSAFQGREVSYTGGWTLVQ